MVGDVPITAIDLKSEVDRNNIKKITSSRNAESVALDQLIEKAIIDQVLKEESISIPESQVDDILKKSMADNGFKDEKAFEQVLRQQMNMSLAEYRKEITDNLKIQQISQLQISVPPPREEAIKEWYLKHKKEIGNKYLLRIIKKKYNPDNPKDELSVNKAMNEARLEAVNNFAAAAIKHSDDPSASKGGLLGWMRIDEMAQKDPTMANVVYRMSSGEVSIVFVSGNNYCIVKVDAAQPVSLEDASPLIGQKLYMENQKEGYKEWIKMKRKTTAVKIFLKNYQNPA